MVDALAARFGGTAYAVGQLSAALLDRPDVRRLVVVTRSGTIADASLRPHPHLRRVRIPEPSRFELLQRVAWEAIRLRRLTERSGAIGVFSLSGMLPRALDCPVVSLLANPVPFEDRWRPGSLVRRGAIARTSRQASAVYVPSTHVAQLVGGGARTRVVPLGVDRARFIPADNPGHELLCVADFYRHKRHDLILDAYEQLAQPRPVLRLIGNPAVDAENFEFLLRRCAGIEGVSVDGHVSFSALLAAYRGARAFVLASERESFCMPLAEALCCGVPVVARDHPVLRETAGPGGWYVPSNSPTAWSDAIRRLLLDDRLHGRLRTEGMRHATRFSWETMAAELVGDLRAAKAATVRTG